MVQSRLAYAVSAPTGRRVVAAGGAARPQCGPTRNPWKVDIPYHLFAPAGRRRFLGRRKDACARRFLRPCGADVLKHERSHGLRTARCAAAGASPVATIRRPVGAKNGDHNYRDSKRPPLAVSPPILPPRSPRLRAEGRCRCSSFSLRTPHSALFASTPSSFRPMVVPPAFHVGCEINNVVSPFTQMRLTSKGPDQNRSKRV